MDLNSDALKEAEIVADDDKRVPTITYTVERYNGKVEVLLWGQDGLGIRTSKDFPLVVNGVKVYCNIPFQQYDGRWDIKRTEHGYIDWTCVVIRQVRDFKDASNSARRKVLEVAKDLVKYTTESRPSAVIQGEVHRLNRWIWRTKREQAGLQHRLHKNIQLVGDLQRQLTEQQVQWATAVALELPEPRRAYVVTLQSHEYGLDQYKYDTEEEALDGYERLQENARTYTAKDGIERTVEYLGYVKVE